MPRKKKNDTGLQPLEKLLTQVKVEDAPEQEDAATFAVDRVTGSVLVRVNPELSDAQSTHGYRLRGLARLILSGLAAYNRDITRMYGKWEKEQATYEAGAENAQHHIEALLHAQFPYEPAE